MGNPKVLLFLYKYRKVRGKTGLFPRETCELLVVRGTTSFCNNKITNFAYWRKCCVECSNVMKWTMLKGNYFVFSCVSLIVRAFELSEPMFLFECSLVYYVIISTMSNGCFNSWRAILSCIYLFMFICFDSNNSYLWFILTCEQYYITHELISCSLGTA